MVCALVESVSRAGEKVLWSIRRTLGAGPYTGCLCFFFLHFVSWDGVREEEEGEEEQSRFSSGVEECNCESEAYAALRCVKKVAWLKTSTWLQRYEGICCTER